MTANIGSGPPGAAHARVLLVEDYPNLARLLGVLLRMQGHDAQIAGDCAAALKLASEQQFDVVISDLSLPDGSGTDLLPELRKRGIERGIALSGYGRAEDIQHSLDAGFSEHLLKPIEFEDLEAAIQRTLAAAPARRAS